MHSLSNCSHFLCVFVECCLYSYLRVSYIVYFPLLRVVNFRIRTLTVIICHHYFCSHHSCPYKIMVPTISIFIDFSFYGMSQGCRHGVLNVAMPSYSTLWLHESCTPLPSRLKPEKKMNVHV